LTICLTGDFGCVSGGFEDRPSAYLRSGEEEFYAKLEDFSGISACQAVTSMPSMEEVSRYS